MAWTNEVARSRRVLLASGAVVADAVVLPRGHTSLVVGGIHDRLAARVVVKISTGPDHRLSRERRVLDTLRRAGLRVPTVLSVDAAIVADTAAPCLVLAVERGRRPRTMPALHRLGATLGHIARASIPDLGLPATPTAAIIEAHHAIIEAIAAELPGPLAEKLCAVRPAQALIGLSHGDPGPDNYLDDRGGGVLIDFEQAGVGPLGLDLARAAMAVSLAGSRSAAKQRVEAVVRGYASTGPAGVGLAPTWWTVAAGQILGWRFRHRARPGTPPWRAVLDRWQDLAAELPC